MLVENGTGPEEQIAPMSLGAKTKLISFRVSEEEYGCIHNVCQANGMRSVSELARAGLNLIMRTPSKLSHELVVSRLTDLEARLQMLTTEFRNFMLRTGTVSGRSTTSRSNKQG
ncbi:MAG: hypothetical protein JWP08_4291 [Bryobacterales bacterium]|jgi:hypothetical protein|nr:hypothetical protein [Bryobacterales bacterium]